MSRPRITLDVQPAARSEDPGYLAGERLVVGKVLDDLRRDDGVDWRETLFAEPRAAT